MIKRFSKFFISLDIFCSSIHILMMKMDVLPSSCHPMSVEINLKEGFDRNGSFLCVRIQTKTATALFIRIAPHHFARRNHRIFSTTYKKSSAEETALMKGNEKEKQIALT